MVVTPEHPRETDYRGCRWTLKNLGVRGPLTTAGDEVEVMPVSEHERWREAFLEGQRADHDKHKALRVAVEGVLDIIADDESGEFGAVQIGSRAWDDAIRDLRAAALGQKHLPTEGGDE